MALKRATELEKTKKVLRMRTPALFLKQSRHCDVRDEVILIAGFQIQ